MLHIRKERQQWEYVPETGMAYPLKELLLTAGGGGGRKGGGVCLTTKYRLSFGIKVLTWVDQVKNTLFASAVLQI